MTSILPTRLKLEPNSLIVEWNDGFRAAVPFKTLRDACPCAACKEEAAKPLDPFRILKPNELAPLGLKGMEPVGRYAYRILWSDGHDTGIFTMEHLRSLCQNAGLTNTQPSS